MALTDKWTKTTTKTKTMRTPITKDAVANQPNTKAESSDRCFGLDPVVPPNALEQ